MQLVEQAKVGLDDDIVKYLPEFTLKQADESSGPVTLRGVLMHAAGLPRETINDTWQGRVSVPDPCGDAGRIRDSRCTTER